MMIDDNFVKQLQAERDKRRVQQAAYQLIHMLAIFFACLATAVAVFATISFWNWNTLVFWIVVLVGLVVVIISILDDVYAYTIVFLLIAADTGWNIYILIVEGYYFYRILYAVFTPDYIPPHCDQPYCEGYRADTFYFFYLLLAGQTGLNLCMLYVYYQIFSIEDRVNKQKAPQTYAKIVPFLETYYNKPKSN